MKITKRQLRQIIEGYNSMSDSGKALAQRAKRQFAKDYPSVKVGIDTREGWLTVDGKKAVNMSQASGSPMELEDVVDKMKQAYLGHPMAESSKSTIKYNADDALKGDQTKLPDKLQKGIIDAEEDEEKVEEGNLTEKQIRILVREALLDSSASENQLVMSEGLLDFVGGLFGKLTGFIKSAASSAAKAASGVASEIASEMKSGLKSAGLPDKDPEDMSKKEQKKLAVAISEASQKTTEAVLQNLQDAVGVESWMPAGDTEADAKEWQEKTEVPTKRIYWCLKIIEHYCTEIDNSVGGSVKETKPANSAAQKGLESETPAEAIEALIGATGSLVEMSKRFEKIGGVNMGWSDVQSMATTVGQEIKASAENAQKKNEAKITSDNLRIVIREIAASVAHPRDNLGKNIADVDFPIVVGYDLNGQMQSEIAYSQDELDEILDYLAPLGGGKGVPYSLDSLSDMEPQDRPVGAEIEQLAAGKIIVTKSQLRKLIREAGLWDNVHAKRKEGRPAAKKGEKGYPDEKSWKAAQEADDSDEQPLEEAENPCWDGYGPGAKSGKKTKKGKGGKRVPNCELQEDDEETLEEAMLYHIDAGVGVDQNAYRPGSTAFFALFREARRQFYEGTYKPKSEDEYELLEDLDIGEFALYEGVWVPLDYPIMEGNEEHLNEAEYQGKKVELNKPIRGGDGSYVYVNSGKKDKDGKIKVKKVSFGSSMPDAMGDNEAHRKRRKSYGDRHNCSDKDDKTKAGYWSCRATKFFGRDISGWW